MKKITLSSLDFGSCLLSVEERRIVLGGQRPPDDGCFRAADGGDCDGGFCCGGVCVPYFPNDWCVW